MDRAEAPRRIGESVYWLGSTDNSDGFLINIYLVYRQGKGVLIDPGPRSVFKETLAALRQIAPLETITAFVVSGKDPNICSSLPSWEEAGFQGRIIAHKKTAHHLKSFGLHSPVFPVLEGDNPITGLEDFFFYYGSYQAAPGTLVTYDQGSGSLFSSCLFGSTGERDILFADESHYAGMIAFKHDFFQSDREIKESLRFFNTLSLERICPLHGCIVNENPQAYLSLLNGDKEEEELSEEEWRRIHFGLNEELILSIDGKMLDSVTGLYNESFFHNFLPEFIRLNPEGLVAFFRIDDMKSFNNTYGFEEGDRAIATFASLLQGIKPDHSYLFRESGPILIVMLPQSEEGERIEVIEQMQNRVRESKDFIQDMTCSVALVRVDEVLDSPDKTDELLLHHIRLRIQLLDSMGNNSICSTSDKEAHRGGEKIILIIDSDPVSPRLLKDYFSHRGYTVYTCPDGGEAMHLIDLYRPQVILSEIMVPQLDGFRIREKLLQSRDLRGTPFLFLSHRKTEDTVLRAHRLGVYYNLKKPVMLSELAGIVRHLTEGE
ncbi:MAG: response regulator [Spirochaetales bacterium]|nr:response regulator [Spirochaetales bacterium]